MPAKKKIVINYYQRCFIRANYLKLSGHDIDQRFGFYQGMTDRFKKQHGLIVPREISIGFRTRKLANRTTSDKKTDRFIRKNYLRMPVNAMANHVGRSETLVKTRMRQLGLVTPKEIIKQFIEMARIKKGSVPPNKGKKQKEYMSKAAIERTKKTRFQKGQIPHNAIGFKDGDIRIRRTSLKKGAREYKYIRVSLGKWMELHRYNWIKKFGPVPKGMNIVFKDDDSLNPHIDNLEIVSDAELMKRNTVHNYPKEIVQVVQLTGALTRKINKHTKKIRNEKQNQ